MRILRAVGRKITMVKVWLVSFNEYKKKKLAAIVTAR